MKILSSYNVILAQYGLEGSAYFIRVSPEELDVKILKELFDEDDIQISAMLDSKLTERTIYIYDLFAQLYMNYLGRALTDAEDRIVKTAIKILMWKIKGKTFSQIVWNRYSYAARTYERREIQADIQNQNICAIWRQEV